MLTAITDSSTLIAMSTIGRLALLRELYGTVTISTAVWQEVVEQGQGRSGAIEVEAACQEGWIEVRNVATSPLLQLLRRDLDDGESEVIALAIEQGAQILLLDESEARRVADLYKLRKTGVIGVLMRAKREGRIGSLQVELDRLRVEAGFRIQDDLYHKALSAVGESKKHIN
ncbi:MAG: DUF3368 domain-containing protein [Blastocatellia bacterium]